jgi:hypothetical protein
MTSDELDLMFLGTADEQADHESLDALILELESEVENIQVSPYDSEYPSVIILAEQRDAQHNYESNVW